MAQADLGDLGLIIERVEARGRLIGVMSEANPVLISPRRYSTSGRQGAAR